MIFVTINNGSFVFRYMTIFFYLNDVKDGGGTAFPVANNETVDLGVYSLHMLCYSFTILHNVNFHLNLVVLNSVLCQYHSSAIFLFLLKLMFVLSVCNF